MVGDLGLRLLVHIQPDQCEKGDQGQGGDESAQLVAALGNFGNNHDDGRSEQIFGDQPAHEFPKIIRFYDAKCISLNYGSWAFINCMARFYSLEDLQ